MGRSALDAVELMNTGVQYLREHIIQEARIHYAITNTGGYSPNVVQPYAEVLYLIRAPKNQQVKEIFERVNDIAKGAALMTGTRMEIQFVKACSNLVDNTVLEEVLQKNLEEIPREPYTEEELAFAKKIYDTYGGDKTNRYTYRILSRYEKSRKAQVEALLAPHMKDIICDVIVPLMGCGNLHGRFYGRRRRQLGLPDGSDQRGYGSHGNAWTFLADGFPGKILHCS